MKISQTLFLILVIVFSVSCSIQSKLNRTYIGKNESFVISKMGEPTRIEKLTGGDKIDVYEKTADLKPVPINTGGFRYDPLESPPSTKIERYWFKISSKGLVENVKYEVSYQR